MESTAQFSHDLIKGKIAELVFELMFRDTGRFTVLRFGYEYTLPELAQYQHLVEVKKVLDNISNAPDFVLIQNEKNGDGKLHVFTVEVKYRTNPRPEELKEIAESTLKTWNPSWLFVASPGGFYFAPCSAVVSDDGAMSPLSDNWVDQKTKAKYLEILKDFELGHA
jgi:hypothetical protein